VARRVWAPPAPTTEAAARNGERSEPHARTVFRNAGT
jgi:hypothetical protein